MKKKIETAIKPDDEIRELLKHSVKLLWNEINHISNLSKKGKLDLNNSRDLINYVKLFREMKKDEDEFIAELTDKELDDLLKKNNL